jgi:undecaprenyl-diphosphatase
MHYYPAYFVIVFGGLAFGGLVVAGWWQARGKPGRIGAALWVSVAAITAFISGQLVVGRAARPSLHDVHPGVSTLFHAVGGLLAPSGVAAMAGAVTAGLFFVRCSLGRAAVVTTTFISIFQVCVIAYSWQDVMAGLIFGIAIALGGYALLGDVLTRLGASIARAGTAGPGRAGPGGTGPGGAGDGSSGRDHLASSRGRLPACGGASQPAPPRP